MRLLPLLPLALLAQAHSPPCTNKTDATRDAIMEIITSPHTDEVDLLAAKSLYTLSKWQKKHDRNNTCTIENAVRRREWSNLSGRERIAYTDAVKCLQRLPAKTNSTYAPGAKSRFDDFVVTHIEQTLSIHDTANFLTWHRYYVYTYEKALRDECGYEGYQPYWNWGKYAKDPIHSPLFDGSETSMGGNGAYVNHTGVLITGTPAPYDVIPPDQGGGCVTTGPFSNMTVNLGPLAASISGVPSNPLPNGLGHNPRCLRRDVNKNSATVTTSNYTYALITESETLARFQRVMQGEFSLGKWGVHTGGHYTVGGDPGGDFFASSGDPTFYLHHGMIDRVYWLWQLQDLSTRLNEVAGTITLGNVPPSRNGTVDDVVGLGVNAKGVRLGELLNTMGGLGREFCYVYV
ncbi:Di-copper centre-containing [Glarea lozoyensis ATCC 20868]|uniref:Di-copper centre-containing n=1 Tax=Glarea lozoyensis (strain ATCC 20868 / MF5171) TaxID=1116229 RepID=S3D6U4_GLAL2|nr:Di-copper centre-containing [Glarea lozoyensis ATCC 20868]EPE34212.1 Di-copper centre-containing [Glarea lozoyensis ATCC 20868]